MQKHGSFFSGIGGFDLAAHWAGWRNVFQVEINPYCQKVLSKNFPNTIRYGDIREFPSDRYVRQLDIISGGPPCQSVSNAGEKKGKKDPRFLWGPYLEAIRTIQPSFVVSENVEGLLSMDDIFEEICTNLEAQGYAVQPFIIPAGAVGAPHRRKRAWIVGYSQSNYERRLRLRQRGHKGKVRGSGCEYAENTTITGLQGSVQGSRKNGEENRKGATNKLERSDQFDSNPHNPGLQIGEGQNPGRTGGPKREWADVIGEIGSTWQQPWIEVATGFCVVDDGLPDGMGGSERNAITKAIKHFGREETEKVLGIDLRKFEQTLNRRLALEAYGNAIVPYVAYQIFEGINQFCVGMENKHKEQSL